MAVGKESYARVIEDAVDVMIVVMVTTKVDAWTAPACRCANNRLPISAESFT